MHSACIKPREHHTTYICSSTKLTAYNHGNMGKHWIRWAYSRTQTQQPRRPVIRMWASRHSQYECGLILCELYSDSSAPNGQKNQRECNISAIVQSWTGIRAQTQSKADNTCMHLDTHSSNTRDNPYADTRYTNNDPRSPAPQH